MKNVMMNLLMLLALQVSAKAESIKTVKTKVDMATVYFAGATLSCTEDFILSPGINELVFEGVAPDLDPNSLQASGKGNFIIMDVKYNVRYNEQIVPVKQTSKNLKAIKLIKDSLSDLGFTIDELNDRLNGLQSEKEILLNNRLMKGETRRDTLEMFEAALEYLRLKLNNINSESYKLKRELFSKNELKQKLTQNLQELQNINNQTGENNVAAPAAVYEIRVTAMADAEAAAKVTISYFVNNAGWKPSYDIRAASGNNTISITQKAQLFQTTGVGWTNATLTLATATPNQSAVKPELSPMYLSFYTAYKNNMYNDIRRPEMSAKKLEMPDAAGTTITPKDEQEEAKVMADFTDMVENLIQTEYSIKLKYNIPSDGKEHLVVIQNKETKADYNFSAVPKLNPNAFLMAKLTGWEDLNLIPGESRIFFDGSFVGKSFIDPNVTTDTLALSLGKDKAIVMTRRKLKDKTREKLIIDEKVMTFSFEISVRNTKNLAVKLDLEDQVPISSSKDIVVKLIESTKAAFTVETGKLAWDLTLKANETKKLLVTYEVRIPKDKTLAGL